MPLSPEQYAVLREQFVEVIHARYGYEIHEDAVRRFHLSSAKTKIVSCPARTSKSYAGWKDVLPDVFLHGSLLDVDPELETQIIWIVAPNYDLAKEFDYAYQDLVERREALGFDYNVVEARKNPGQGDMKIRIRWGKNAAGRDVDTLVVVKSAANEKQLQSEEVDIAILSEAARLQEIVWSKYLSTRVGRSIWPTTPDIEAAWIHKLIEDSTGDPRLQLEHFQFTPRANPDYKYDRYWIEHAKAENRVDAAAPPTVPVDDRGAPGKDNGHDCFDELTQCRAMKDAGFAEQFGGLWTFHRGRVVPIRTEESRKGEHPHVIDYEKPWFKHADVHVSFDYGYTDGVCVLFWLVGPHQVVLRRSIYDKGLIPDEVVEKTNLIIDEMGWRGRVTRMVGDPKKPEVVELFRRRGLPIWDVDKKAQVDRKAGHLELMNYLADNPATGEPTLLVHSDNPAVIDEWKTLRYNDRVKYKDEGTHNSMIGGDHAYDAARYFVMARPPVEKTRKKTSLDDSEFARVRKQILAMQRPKRIRTVPKPSSRSWIGA